MTARLFICAVGAVVLLASRPGEPLAVFPGLGVPSLVEMGWSPDTVFDRIGKGKKFVHRNRECVRYTERYRRYGALDLDVHFNRYVEKSDTARQRVDWLRFGPRSMVITNSGIAIGRSTRADVYAVHGPDRPNPNAYYDTLGIGFGFNCAAHRPYLPTDTVEEIWIFPPRPE